jgi:hypothetical protein
MTGNDSIQQHITGLRQVAEEQYRQRLAAIDDLESSLLGTRPHTNGVAKEPVPPTGAMGANIVRLREALSGTEYRTIRELSKLTGLNQFAVRNALKTRTLKPFIEFSKDGVGPFRVRLSSTPTQQHATTGRAQRAKGVGGMVREYLGSHPQGATSRDMADYIIPRMKTKSKNPKNRVQSTISKMKKSGALTHNVATGVYRLAK